MLWGQDYNKNNFATEQEFNKTRAAEMKSKGLNVDFNEVDLYMSSKIDTKVSNIRASSQVSAPSAGNVATNKHVGPEMTVQKNMGDDETMSVSNSPELPQQKSSKYSGVSFQKTKMKFSARKRLGGKMLNFGHYTLKVDAAFARDIGIKQLKIEADLNFDTLQAYEDAKRLELEKRGLDSDVAMSSAAITSKVVEHTSKHRPKPNAKGTKTITAPRSNIPQANSKPLRLTGVTFVKSTKKYSSRVTFLGKCHSIGSWALASDAALAHDKATELLKGVDCGRINFSSRRSYENSRMREMQKLKQTNPGASIVNVRDIVLSIQKHLSKIPCPEIDLINDAIAKKWAQHLPEEEGEEFIDSYQKNIDDVLLELRNEVDSSATVISNGTGQKVDIITNPDAFFKPIMEGDDSSSVPQDRNVQNNTAPAALAEGESDDDESLFRDNDYGEDMDISDNNSTEAESEVDKREEPAPEHNKVNSASVEVADELATNEPEVLHPAVQKAKTTSTTEATTDQKKEADAEMKEGKEELNTHQRKEADAEKRGGKEEFIFPVGCPVLWNFDGKSFCQGKINSVAIYDTPTNNTEYDVIPTKNSGHNSTRIKGKYLSLGLECPVYVSSSDGDSQKSLDAKILMCQAKACEQTSVQAVLQLKDSLVKEEARMSSTAVNQSEVNENLLTILKKLDAAPMKVSILKETLIGKALKELKTNDDHRISNQARKLVKKWKGTVKAEKNKTSNNDTNAPSLEYTVLITKEGNQFQIMQNVLPECVRYRRAEEVEVAVPAESKELAKDKRMPAQDPPAEQRRTQELAHESRSQSSSQQYSSNSTITTVETDPQRQCNSATDGNNDDCRVYFPRWLPKQTLLCEF